MQHDMIEMKFDAADVGEELWNEFRAQSTKLDEVRKLVAEKLMKSPKVTFFKSMTRIGSYGSYKVVFDTSYGNPIMRAKPTIKHGQYQQHALAHMSDKTVNVLLGGKLLDDGQKKAMVKLMVPQLFDNPEETPAE